MAPFPPGAGATTLRRLLVFAALAACGCRSTGPDLSIASMRAAGVGSSSESLVPRVCRARREGRRLERQGVDASVDHYYRATVFAAAAVTAAPGSTEARDLYNECLVDCLRAGQVFGRLDARRALRVHGPNGTTTVPIRRIGFVWADEDFDRVVDPASAPPNPSAHADNETPGLGAAIAVERVNPKRGGQDDFLPRNAVFNATAVLRPDLDAWLSPAGRAPADVLELYDPLRVPDVPFGPASSPPLHVAPNAAIAVARQIQVERGPYALAGFATPERMLGQADIRMIEPHQPGKSPILLIHGLVNDPFLFNDMLAALQRTPGFLDRYQVWVYRYPTGVTFLRTAAILRAEIERISRTLDPDGADPALRNWTLVGFSLGGMIARLQVSHSGDAVWNAVATRPFQTLRIDDQARRAIKDMLFFEPSPRVRRVIFLATPHDGASPPASAASLLTSWIVQRPADSRRLIEKVERDNPGAVRPTFRRLPSSVDALAAYSPLLPAIRGLPYDPAVEIHTIAGTGFLNPAYGGFGDLVVPLSSAHVDEAVSEHHVRAVHTAIYYNPDAIAEVQRILGFAPAWEVD